MRPAVVTAALMLTCILDTDIHWSTSPNMWQIKIIRAATDGATLMRIAVLNLSRGKKTFHEAQEHCRTLDGDLLSINSSDEMLHLLRSDFYASVLQNFWIGAMRSEGGFRYTDGSEFNSAIRDHGQPNSSDGQEDCVKLNIYLFMFLNNVRCSEKRNFVCAKKM